MKSLNLFVVAMALGVFGAITFTLCIAWDLAFPTLSMARAWELVLPGFRGITPGGYALGLGESFFYGVYAALVFVPLYNWLARCLAGGQASGDMSHA